MQFQWPTKVAVNPIDGSVYITDENTVYMLTPDGYVKIVAGTPLHCQSEQQTSPLAVDQMTLAPIRDMAFSPSGDLFLAETDEQFVHQVGFYVLCLSTFKPTILYYSILFFFHITINNRVNKLKYYKSLHYYKT